MTHFLKCGNLGQKAWKCIFQCLPCKSTRNTKISLQKAVLKLSNLRSYFLSFSRLKNVKKYIIIIHYFPLLLLNKILELAVNIAGWGLPVKQVPISKPGLRDLPKGRTVVTGFLIGSPYQVQMKEVKFAINVYNSWLINCWIPTKFYFSLLKLSKMYRVGKLVWAEQLWKLWKWVIFFSWRWIILN